MLTTTRRMTAMAIQSKTEARADKSRYKPVIGLEVHVQLNTRTKLFSRTPTSEASPNRHVSPFDMATPGVLPVLNRQCVLKALKMARLLRCHIPERSRFDRKHYFYADMPAGYQITQNENPIARGGKFGFYVFDEHLEPYWKQVDIIQLQLEQDSGKTIHIDGRSLVDYNRAGCALVEVVTTPCFTTALEAIRFVQHLRLLLIHHDVCHGDLHRGHMRVDANVSLAYDGALGTRTEIKNMNSIRCIHTAINFEIARQFEILKTGGRVSNETRAATPEGRTVQMRDKEEETDYRFMAEPNLPAVRVRTEWLQQVERELEESGKPKFEWLRDECGFDARSSIHIAEDPELFSFVEKCTRSKHPSVTADDILYWMKELKTSMQRSKVNYPPQSVRFAEQFMQIVLLARQHRLTRLRLLELLRLYSSADEHEHSDVVEFVEKNDFWRIDDATEIDRIVDENLRKHEKLAAKLREGHAKSFTRMRNIIVDATQKRVELEDVERSLRRHGS
ncbi:unnamed protein product [Caenorhabditis sp. 36 PRJEB53466]|nr:unnamed protein product [Caenorhabditis sp. 36 PRJEB53466]